MHTASSDVVATVSSPEAYHEVTAVLGLQGSGCPPAGQLLRLQALKAKLLQILHLDAQDAGLPGIKPIHVPILRWGLLHRVGIRQGI